MSSYSSLRMYMVLKVVKEARIDPPIHTEYLRSLGATILTFMVAGAESRDLLIHAISNARVHGSST